MTLVVSQNAAIYHIRTKLGTVVVIGLTEGKPGKDNRKYIVKKLYVEEQHSHYVVAAFVHSSEMHQGVDCSRERSIKPSSSLADKFRCSFRDIRLTPRSLNVSQMPLLSLLGDQLKAKNPIFGQEHVFLENIHVLNALTPVHLRCCVVTEEILIQRPTHDSTIAIGRERAGQDTHIPKRTFQWLVQDIADLVLKILSRNKRVEKILPTFPQHCVDLPASSAKILVIIERFP